MSSIAKEIRDLLRHQSMLMQQMLEALHASPRLEPEPNQTPVAYLFTADRPETLTQEEYELELERLDTIKGQIPEDEWLQRRRALNAARRRAKDSKRS